MKGIKLRNQTQFLLKENWKNQNDGKFTDLVFILDNNQRLESHSFVLANFSTLIMKLVNAKRYIPCEKLHITLTNCKFETLRMLLQFIYTGTATLKTEADYSEFEQMAKLFQIHNVTATKSVESNKFDLGPAELPIENKQKEIKKRNPNHEKEKIGPQNEIKKEVGSLDIDNEQVESEDDLSDSEIESTNLKVDNTCTEIDIDTPLLEKPPELKSCYIRLERIDETWKQENFGDIIFTDLEQKNCDDSISDVTYVNSKDTSSVSESTSPPTKKRKITYWDESSLVCFCKKSFSVPSLYKRHLVRAHFYNQLMEDYPDCVCPFCKKVYAKKGNTLDHIALYHHKIFDYCDKKQKVHIMPLFEELSPSETNIKDTEQSTSSPVSEPSNNSSIDDNVINETKSDTIVCDFCDGPFDNVSKYLTHLSLFHFKEDLKEKFSDMFVASGTPCKWCTVTPINSSAMLLHIGVKHQKVTELIPEEMLKSFQIFEKNKLELVKKSEEIESSVSASNKKDTKGKIFCKHCDKSLKNVDQLLRHLSAVHFRKELKKRYSEMFKGDEGDMKCKWCTVIPKSSYSMLLHIGATHGKVMECNDIAVTKQKLHVKKVKSTSNIKIGQLMTCNLCKKSNLAYNALLRHLSGVHFITELKEKYKELFQESPVKCTWCENTPKNQYDMVRHIGGKHRKVLEFTGLMSSELNVNNKIYQFQKCKKIAQTDVESNASKNIIVNNSENNSSRITFVCIICSEKMKNYSDLLRHLSSAHFREKLEEKYPDLFKSQKTQCKWCQLIPESKCQMFEHIGSQHGKVEQFMKEKFINEQCMKEKPVISTSISMSNQTSEEKKIKAYQELCARAINCHYCNKMYYTHSAILKHLSSGHFSHKLREKYPEIFKSENFQCKWCYYKTVNSSTMVCHIGGTHKKVVQFITPELQAKILQLQCDYCKQAFGNNITVFLTHLYQAHFENLMRMTYSDTFRSSGGECKLCFYETKDLNKFLEHISVNHRKVTRYVTPEIADIIESIDASEVSLEIRSNTNSEISQPLQETVSNNCSKESYQVEKNKIQEKYTSFNVVRKENLSDTQCNYNTDKASFQLLNEKRNSNDPPQLTVQSSRKSDVSELDKNEVSVVLDKVPTTQTSDNQNKVSNKSENVTYSQPTFIQNSEGEVSVELEQVQTLQTSENQNNVSNNSKHIANPRPTFIQNTNEVFSSQSVSNKKDPIFSDLNELSKTTASENQLLGVSVQKKASKVTEIIHTSESEAKQDDISIIAECFQSSGSQSLLQRKSNEDVSIIRECIQPSSAQSLLQTKSQEVYVNQNKNLPKKVMREKSSQKSEINKVKKVTIDQVNVHVLDTSTNTTMVTLKCLYCTNEFDSKTTYLEHQIKSHFLQDFVTRFSGLFHSNQGQCQWCPYKAKHILTFYVHVGCTHKKAYDILPKEAVVNLSAFDNIVNIKNAFSESGIKSKNYPSITCDYCPHKLFSKKDFLIHQIEKHLKKFEEKYQPIFENKEGQCQLCPNKFEEIKEFLIHLGFLHKKAIEFLPQFMKQKLLASTGTNTFTCFCLGTREFKSYFQFKTHLLRHHYEPNVEAKYSYCGTVCPICDMVFATHSDVIEHIGIGHDKVIDHCSQEILDKLIDDTMSVNISPNREPSETEAITQSSTPCSNLKVIARKDKQSEVSQIDGLQSDSAHSHDTVNSKIGTESTTQHSTPSSDLKVIAHKGKKSDVKHQPNSVNAHDKVNSLIESFILNEENGNFSESTNREKNSKQNVIAQLVDYSILNKTNNNVSNAENGKGTVDGDKHSSKNLSKTIGNIGSIKNMEKSGHLNKDSKEAETIVIDEEHQKQSKAPVKPEQNISSRTVNIPCNIDNELMDIASINDTNTVFITEGESQGDNNLLSKSDLSKTDLPDIDIDPPADSTEDFISNPDLLESSISEDITVDKMFGTLLEVEHRSNDSANDNSNDEIEQDPLALDTDNDQIMAEESV